MPIPPQLLDLLFTGESETLEFKAQVRDPVLLARLIAGFANASGGRLLVGVKEPPEIVAIDRQSFEKTLAAACALLEPQSEIAVRYIETDSGDIADITVAKSTKIVLVQGAAFIRSSTLTRPMAWGQIRLGLPAKPDESGLEKLLQQSEKQTALLERIAQDNERLRDQNELLARQVAALSDPSARRRERIFGGAIGVVASLIAALLWLLVTRQVPWLRGEA